jgi:hypothetical protein
MKQIRFKNFVHKIDACYECPIFNGDSGYCQDGASIHNPWEEDTFPKDCQLEEYEGKESLIEISKFDFEELLMDAVRYALGRMTYTPHIVCEIINKNINVVSKGALGVIKKDIEKERDRDNLGDPIIDAPVWINTLENINEKLNELNSNI